MQKVDNCANTLKEATTLFNCNNGLKNNTIWGPLFALAMIWSDVYSIYKLRWSFFWKFFRVYDFTTNILLIIALVLRGIRLSINDDKLNETSHQTMKTMEEVEVGVFANVIVMAILRFYFFIFFRLGSFMTRPIIWPII